MHQPPDDAVAPPWLHALGLQGMHRDAVDERMVRRAYAQRLRTIDQSTEAAAFQALREAYDAALGALRQRAAPGPAADHTSTSVAPTTDAAAAAAAATATASGEDTAPVPSTVHPADALPQAAPAVDAAVEARRQIVEQAQAVYEVFVRQVDAVFTDEAQARTALQQALDDDRLTSLDARTAFEWQVGCLLMNGWRPGHERLFGPACELFDWERDRRRLVQFGELGAALDQAIQERLIFLQQSAVDVVVQRQLIRRMRSDEPPSDAALNAELPSMVTLMQRHPNWLPAITSLPNLRAWHARHQQLHAATADAARPRPPSPRPADPTVARPWMPLVFLLAGLGAIANFLGNGRHDGTAPGVPAARVSPYAPPRPLPEPATRDSAAPNLFLTTGAAKPLPVPTPVQMPVRSVDGGVVRQSAAAGKPGPTAQPDQPASPAAGQDGLLDLVPHDAAYKLPTRPEPVRPPPIVGIPAMPVPGAGSVPPTSGAPATATRHPAGSGGLNSHPAPDATLPTLNERWQRPSYELVPRESPFVPPTSLTR